MTREDAPACDHRHSRDDLRQKVRRLIERHQLIGPNDVALVAVSGGMDSVALLDVLVRLVKPLALRLHVGHVNHGLRGAESDGDAHFVAEMAAEMGVPFHLRTLALSPRCAPGKRHASPESEWRESRYRALREMADQARARCVVLGHTRDDLAETVLMRLMRGSGLEGLAAFGPVGEVEGMRLCRPLIETSRDEIRRYVRARGLRWREDPSNQDVARTRNRIRGELIPLIRRLFNPAIQAALARTAELAGCDNAFLEAQAQEVWRRWWAGDAAPETVPGRLALARLRDCPPALLRRLLRRWLMAIAGAPYPPSFGEIQELYNLTLTGRTGACYEYQRRWRFLKTRDHIEVALLPRSERKAGDINPD